MNGGNGGVSTWQRWTIGEIDLGVARLAVAQARYPLESTVAEAEATDAEADAGGSHGDDDQLGIHYTSRRLSGAGGPAGSIAYVMKANGTPLPCSAWAMVSTTACG